MSVSGQTSTNQIGRTMRQFTAFGSDIDLTDGANGPNGMPARGFMVNDVGTASLVVDTATETGVTIDVTNLQGAYVPVALKAIDSASNIASIIVFW